MSGIGSDFKNCKTNDKNNQIKRIFNEYKNEGGLHPKYKQELYFKVVFLVPKGEALLSLILQILRLLLIYATRRYQIRSLSLGQSSLGIQVLFHTCKCFSGQMGEAEVVG